MKQYCFQAILSCKTVYYLLFQLKGKSRFPPKKFYNIDYWTTFPFLLFVTIFCLWLVFHFFLLFHRHLHRERILIKLRSIEDLIYYYFFEREKTIFVLKVDVLPPLLQGFPYLEMRYSIQIVNSRNEWVKGQNSGFF